MYQASPYCNPPSGNAVLWRYMDFTKFVSLLEKQALFFARTDKLDDPFEGYWPDRNRVAARRSLEESTDPHRDLLLQTWLDVLQKWCRFTLINCWHESDHESDAMWKLYSKDDNGIAIKTDFDSFARSFTASEDIFIGRVSYVDYETAFFTDRNSLEPFLCKRKSFEHEREVRAIIQIWPLKKEGDKELVDFSQDICGVGNYYKVDLSLLIHEVVVAPYAQDWFLELIQSVAVRYNLKAPVIKSRLADSPTWG